MSYQFYKLAALPKGLFKACIVPRPIGWISTCSKEGYPNLAPFSYFNAVCDDPPMVMFSTTNAHRDGGPKDSLLNVEETGEFVVNIATFDLRNEVNLSSADLSRATSEFEYAKIASIPSTLVKPLRVAKSPIQIECQYFKSVQLPGSTEKNINRLVLGTVIGIHVSTEILTDGLVDIHKLKPIARLGYNDYTAISKKSTIFSMIRPVIP